MRSGFDDVLAKVSAKSVVHEERKLSQNGLSKARGVELENSDSHTNSNFGLGAHTSLPWSVVQNMSRCLVTGFSGMKGRLIVLTPTRLPLESNIDMFKHVGNSQLLTIYY